MKTKEILLGAADLLERDGWCQLEYQDFSGSRCVVGALSKVLDVDIDSWEGSDEDIEIRTLIRGDEILDLTFWNDNMVRTAEEVIAKLREVAESLV